MNMHQPCFLQYLLLILVPLLLSASAYDRSGEFTFDGFSGNDLITMDAASVTNGLLSLTSGQKELRGHAFYAFPLDFTSAAVPNSSAVLSFSTTFVFAIIGPYDDYDLSGHGLAFVLSSTNGLFTALPSQYLGLLTFSMHGMMVTHQIIFLQSSLIPYRTPSSMTSTTTTLGSMSTACPPSPHTLQATTPPMESFVR
jgi:hypothetical protein